jgi:Arc/MetJ-type ribon-helix-helix transcriptional regulator
MSSLITSVNLDEDSEKKLAVLVAEMSHHRSRSGVIRAAIRAMYADHQRRKQSRRKASTTPKRTVK